MNNIIDKGELGDIYFLEDGKRGNSDVGTVSTHGTDYLQFHGYTLLSKPTIGDTGELTIPAKMFQLSVDHNHFKIHKIKSEYVEKIYELKEDNSLDRWVDPGNQLAHVKQVKTASGDQLGINFQRSFLLKSKKMELSETKSFSLNLNFFCISNTGNYNRFYVSGMLRNNRIILNPSWVVNDWVIDHPYGKGIFERDWLPTIFLSKPKKSFELIKVIGVRLGSSGYLRGIQSYRISMSDNNL